MEPTEVERLRTEVESLREQVKEYEELVREMSVPVIPSIVSETILIPITGKLSLERLEMIFARITERAYEFSYTEGVNTVIIDFTAISERELGELDILGTYIENTVQALKLMGLQVLFVGFSPSVTQALIRSGVSVVDELRAFSSFRTALSYLMEKKGLVFRKKE